MSMIFEQIGQPYEYSDSENQKIADHYKSASDWTKEPLDSVKSSLREHLRVWQLNEKVDVLEYPADGASFKIVHPYFDRYSDHIAILANSVYQSKSDKGANLIAMCHLYRLASVEEKAKKSKMAQSLVYSLYNDELTEEERRQKMDEIKRIISDM